jgi:hypothetical protein
MGWTKKRCCEWRIGTTGDVFQQNGGETLLQGRAAIDSSMMRAHRSGNSMPTAFAAFGSRLLLVMPGMVLISSTKGA